MLFAISTRTAFKFIEGGGGVVGGARREEKQDTQETETPGNVTTFFNHAIEKVQRSVPWAGTGRAGTGRRKGILFIEIQRGKYFFTPRH